MIHEKPKSEQSMVEGIPSQEPSTIVEKQELTPEEETKLAGFAIEAIGGKKETELSQENYREVLEKSILDGVHELPELLADKLKTVDAKLLNEKAQEIIAQISQEKDPAKVAELQTELIYQYIGIISRVQNGGDKGFTPLVAKEVGGLDCSLSTWALKEKLQASSVENISFEFGNPTGHIVGIIKVADGRKMYVDAQNGLVEEVHLENVVDEDNSGAKSIFEIKSHKRLVGHLPNEGEVARTRKEGIDYVAKYLDIRKDGSFLTLGNMHMYVNPKSSVFNTEAAKKFRESQEIPSEISELSEEKWQGYYKKFESFLKKVSGETIYDTKFGKLEDEHHADYEIKKQIDEIKESL